ncbi:hypothetical protein CW751_05630 [Brumimicrobium salinarum]|uniref:DUF4252 domain-containing protein n=1 Tax=Brumimicrobium salinarum TaxID=2058658 RepID=A0A2I0R3A2_9FLAO|nr:hypothetical protein [Brumimicrobium salinarum]PKR81064.1 hypothetical protein CW751_05630 [Brumimicrobium salinarum]
MKKSIYLLLFFALTACTTSNQSNEEIILFNNIGFKINNHEKEIKPSIQIKENYLAKISNKKNQIPLFKIIKGKNHHIFIGLPVATSLENLHKNNLMEDAIKLENKFDKHHYDFNQFQNQDTLLTEYTRLLNNNLIYILAVTTNKELSDSLFTFEKLSDRIKKIE